MHGTTFMIIVTKMITAVLSPQSFFLRNAEFEPLVDGSGLKLLLKPYSVNALQCDLTALPSQHLQIGHKKGITIL